LSPGQGRSVGQCIVLVCDSSIVCPTKQPLKVERKVNRSPSRHRFEAMEKVDSEKRFLFFPLIHSLSAHATHARSFGHLSIVSTGGAAGTVPQHRTRRAPDTYRHPSGIRDSEKEGPTPLIEKSKSAFREKVFLEKSKSRARTTRRGADGALRVRARYSPGTVRTRAVTTLPPPVSPSPPPSHTVANSDILACIHRKRKKVTRRSRVGAPFHHPTRHSR
jgi:hypothetical protein